MTQDLILMPRPHDLVWCASSGRPFTMDSQTPDWLNEVWHTGLPLVVRRASGPASQVPVGVRGPARHQRHATWIDLHRIRQRTTPQQIALAEPWLRHPRRNTLSALLALRQLAPILTIEGIDWGISGAAGFELASGHPALHDGSDLDLTFQCPHPVTRTLAQDWLMLASAQSCRVDIQLETPFGGIALAEWARGARRCLLKTRQGPYLISDPWRSPQDQVRETPSS